MTYSKFTTRSLVLAFSIVLASCGSSETQPDTSSSTQAQSQVQSQTDSTQAQSLTVPPLDILKQYNRAMKRGDSSAVTFATGKAATVKSYDYLKTSSSGFSIVYSDPLTNQDATTIDFKVSRDNAVQMYTAHLIKIDGAWKVEKIEAKK